MRGGIAGEGGYFATCCLLLMGNGREAGRRERDRRWSGILYDGTVHYLRRSVLPVLSNRVLTDGRVRAAPRRRQADHSRPLEPRVDVCRGFPDVLLPEEIHSLTFAVDADSSRPRFRSDLHEVGIRSGGKGVSCAE